MARHWPPPDGPSKQQYIEQLTHDLEEARDAMARHEHRSAKRWVRAALDREHPETVSPAETVALVALGLGVAEVGDVVELPSRKDEPR
jgi:hypothetical protein